MFNRQRRAMSPATDEGLAAAISAGVDAGTPSDVKEAKGDGDGQQPAGGEGAADGGGTGGAEGGEGGEAGAGGGGDGAGDPPAGEGGDGKGADKGGGGGEPPAGEKKEGKGEGDADPPDGRERDEHGRFKKREAGAGGEPEAGKDGAGKSKPPAKPDHVNDPIPEEVKGRTRERMEGLVATAKDLNTKLAAAQTQNDDLMKAIGETGTTPEQFGTVMDVLTQLNSDDPKVKREGIAALRKIADEETAALGDTPPGKDPLEGHQDLIDEVEDGTITKQRAIELATARNREKAGTRREAEHTEADQHVAAINAGKKALNELEASLTKSDPLYKAKRAQIEDAFRVACETLPPAKWASTYQRMYKAAKVAAPPPNTNVRQRVPAGTGGKNQGRPGQNANAGGPSAPKSLEEAVNMGIEQAGRR